ncbi:MAG: CBS domain-containing protein [Burkholderiales bacterium]|nr:CBS domain-containing protein [Burkholderiales bacterium]
MLTLVTARIRDAFLRKPHYVDGGADLITVCRELSARGLTQALVRDRSGGVERLGIFTTTDLRDALLRDELPSQLAVREVAHFELVEVDADADLFEALWLMVRHRVHRLVVRDGGQVAGLLGQLDLVSFVANHSHIVALQIDDATSVAELGPASRRIDEVVSLLHGSGIRIERITRLVNELNRRLFARLWALLAPPAIIADSCLLVMGSEGRGEQILKTDQDNALLLRDGCDEAAVAALAQRFNAALTELGYPPCPGDIMVTNPIWRQPQAAFRDTIRSWIYGTGLGPHPDGPMHLAIFFDAACVAGDASLLEAARAYLDQILAGQEPFLGRFAAAADQFQEPGNWFTRLTNKRDDTPLDLKKLGTFPIVHGVRALALQYGVREQGTAARLTRLVELQRIDAALARDLVDALHLLMGVRLTHQLRQRANGQPASNEVRPGELSTLEREPLHDALAIVKRFRAFLRLHFKFDAL